MKKLSIIFSVLLFITSCGKDDDNCLSDITEEIQRDIYYNKILCSGVQNFEWKYDSYQEYQSTQCSPNVPVELGYNGIVLAQGVKVPYVGPQGGDPGYELDVKIIANPCEKFIDFKFILTTIDTSRIFEHNENVIVLLNGIDSTYTVNFSHEIILYSE